MFEVRIVGEEKAHTQVIGQSLTHSGTMEIIF